MATWFEDLTGFRETTADEVRQNIRVDGTQMTSVVNGRSFSCGTLSVPTLGDLRTVAESQRASVAGNLSMKEVIADAGALHADPANADAMFQVASQFNLLEMVGPSITPEAGVSGYENDPTQGPACAIAAGAATIYRNYFVEVDGQPGQTADRQVDCLADVGRLLGNDGELWTMRNGYAMFTDHGAQSLHDQLTAATDIELDQLRRALRIGIHEGVEVTLPNAGHRVAQAFCSALPVGYNNVSAELLAPFAQLVLEASYEATFAAAVDNFARTGNPMLYLTLIGGGVFANDQSWILGAIERAANLYRPCRRDVAIASHRSSSPLFVSLVDRFDSWLA